MKKMIITIILFTLIVVGVVLYRNIFNNRYADMISDGNVTPMVQGFLDEMISHHKEAVDSSLKIMNNLDITEKQVRIFAANVVDTQSFEMSRMENMYQDFLLKEYDPTVGSKSYHTMMGDMTNLKGDELAQVYAKDMINHHEKAIEMASEYVKMIDKIRKASGKSENGLTITNSHPAIDVTYDLAKQIIDTQTKEIEQMKGWNK